MKKRSPSGELLTIQDHYAHAHAVIRPLFSPDNVRTRTHARGTVSPPFFLRQRARARVVCICVICVISERLQSASGAVTVQIRALPCSMIEERRRGRTSAQAVFVLDYVRALCTCARAENGITFLPTKKCSRPHIFPPTLRALGVRAIIDRIGASFFNRQRARVREASREFPPPIRAHVKQCRERERITGTTRGIISSRRGTPGLPFLVGYL